MTPPLSGGADLALSAEMLSTTAAGVSTPIPAELDDAAVIDLREVRPHHVGNYERWVKPLIDRVAAAILLLAVTPVLALCAIAVAVSLGRPILLRQRRVGYRGDEFTIYKFRTMQPSRRSARMHYVGPERRRTHKHPHDPRLTSVGRFLRTWSLDELPQLLNVVRGEMSLVGPRPEMVEIVERYEPWQHRRHQVKPGVTGLWQVSARGDAPMHELTQVDLEYLDRVSLWTDLRILLLTVPAAAGLRRGF